ncbi:hypothetical protein ABB07_38670 [Streptomyces incarnatus]|uniref:Uncharacterized protein n=1 Tax=Streptomyces incarnatus TaxID=665007 RepID=A0ABN4GPN6_9ACTN|nr:hypothetical protein [Streptomyces incarnatus]AKJ15755.1 hypothetical protein ABB07_38670 [Streptomyces incarnatus]
MTTFPGSPRTVRGGFVVMDGDGRAVVRTIPFQYNPETLTRTLTPRGAATDTGDRLEALRLVGPPVETMKLEIVLDATDRLEKPDQNPTTVAEGLAADLAELETMISPATDDLVAAEALAGRGTLEILPLPSPLLLLVLGVNRTLPVRITEFTVTEEAFDTRLNPILARLGLGVRVLSFDDLPPGSKGAELFLTAARRRERLAARRGAGLQSVGLSRVP